MLRSGLKPCAQGAATGGRLIERDRLTLELEQERRHRAAAEGEVERRLAAISASEAELAAVRQSGAQTATELTRRWGSFPANVSHEKHPSKSLRDAERRLRQPKKRLSAGQEARQRSDNARIVALEKQLAEAMQREAALELALARAKPPAPREKTTASPESEATKNTHCRNARAHAQAAR